MREDFPGRFPLARIASPPRPRIDGDGDALVAELVGGPGDEFRIGDRDVRAEFGREAIEAKRHEYAALYTNRIAEKAQALAGA